MRVLGWVVAVCAGLAVVAGEARAQGFRMLETHVLETRFGHGDLEVARQIIGWDGVH